MRWPFGGGIERRQSDGPDAVTQGILQLQQGQVPTVSGIVEVAAAVVSRAFASATPAGAQAALYTPDVLATIGADLIRNGESVWYRAGVGAAARLMRAVAAPEVSVDRNGVFRYSGMLQGRRVLHVRYRTDWQTGRGIAPVRLLGNLAVMAANLEARMAEEAGSPVGYILPVPAGGEDETVTQLRTDLGGLKGRTALVRTTAAGWGEGRVASPHQDYEPKRIGARIPDANVALLRRVQDSLLAGLGIPSELISASDATGNREAWRRALHNTFQPLGRLLEAASNVAGLGVSLGWDSLMASDVQGRARAFQSMVGGGMEVGRAAALSGLLSED